MGIVLFICLTNQGGFEQKPQGISCTKPFNCIYHFLGIYHTKVIKLLFPLRHRAVAFLDTKHASSWVTGILTDSQLSFSSSVNIILLIRGIFAAYRSLVILPLFPSDRASTADIKNNVYKYVVTKRTSVRPCVSLCLTSDTELRRSLTATERGVCGCGNTDAG